MAYELWLRLSRDHTFRRLARIVALDRPHRASKSYTLMHVGRSDRARLVPTYGVARGVPAMIVRKSWKIASRLIGVKLVNAANSEAVVFNAIRESRLRLLLRQVSTPRAAMSTGDQS